MSNRTTKSKQKGLSGIGQQLANSKSNFELAFDQIKNLVFLVKTLGPWKADNGIISYRRLIMATLKQKGGNKKGYIKNHVEPYIELWDTFSEMILEEDMTFLVEKTITIQVGKKTKKGEAQLELSKVYNWCLDNDENDIVTDIEAKLFHIFKNLCDDKETKTKLEEICENFELEEDKTMQDAIGSIVRKVKGSIGDMGTDAQPSIESLAPLIQKLVGDSDIHAAMGNLAQNLMNGKTDIAGLVNNVKKSVIVNNTYDEETEDSDDTPELIRDDSSE